MNSVGDLDCAACRADQHDWQPALLDLQHQLRRFTRPSARSTALALSRKTTRLPNAYGATQHWIARAVRRAGVHLLFLPQYSPDLNPIEQVFAKLKGMLRKANARSIAAVWHRIGELLRRFTPAECSNYFRHAGYASP